MVLRFSMLVAGVLWMGCGAAGADLCNRQPACPNDVPATQAERDQCKATLDANRSAQCYSEGIAMLTCQADNLVCGGDGKVDAALSATKSTNNCTNQRANLTSCCIKNPNSTVCL